jgi:hypothetical protein
LETFKFRTQVAELAGGRDAVLAQARAMLETTHPVTRAGDRSKIAPDSARRHVVATILEGVKILVRASLIEAADDHLAAVLENYELIEGPQPEDDATAWLKGFNTAVWDGFQGDVEATVGGAALQLRIDRDDTTEDLVDAILARPVEDTARALGALGVTAFDIEALAEEACGRAPTGATAVVTVTSGAVSTGGSETVAEGVGYSEAPTVIVNGQAPAAPQRRRRAAAQAGPPSPVSEAARGALTALVELSAIPEGDIATAIGVSRAQMNNYRHGRTVWHPDDAQAEALVSMIERCQRGLAEAGQAFEMALL